MRQAELLNWLLGVVETHPDGLSAEGVARVKQKLEAAVGDIVRGQIEEERQKQAMFEAQSSMMAAKSSAIYGHKAIASGVGGGAAGTLTTTSAGSGTVGLGDWYANALDKVTAESLGLVDKPKTVL